MKFSEILAIVLIAAVVFIIVLVLTTIYTYQKEGYLQIVQIALAVVVALAAVLLAGFRRQAKKAERILAKQEITDQNSK